MEGRGADDSSELINQLQNSILSGRRAAGVGKITAFKIWVQSSKPERM